MDPEEVNSTYTEMWELYFVEERPKVHAEISSEAVSYCDLAQNLERVQSLNSKKDLDKPSDEYPIVHKGWCNLFLF